MDSAEARAWLAQEVRDLLDVGSVGLYELVDMLTGLEFRLHVDEARSISKDLVSDLMARGFVSIGLVKWPKDEVVDGLAGIGVLDECASWERLPDNHYFALVPR